jgi:hypothetical protein
MLLHESNRGTWIFERAELNIVCLPRNKENYLFGEIFAFGAASVFHPMTCSVSPKASRRLP